jgi:tRNA(Arg) A34 adenosine deaminase TadA
VNEQGPDAHFMRMAIRKAMEGVREGGSPFGACVVRGTEVVACVHNVVWQSMDITAHAEVHALRMACRELDTIDLTGCTIYATTEPCPMCFSAIHWARCGRIVFGTSIADARALGFHELTISNEQMKQLGGAEVQVEGGFLRDECLAVFEAFGARPAYPAVLPGGWKLGRWPFREHRRGGGRKPCGSALGARRTPQGPRGLMPSPHFVAPCSSLASRTAPRPSTRPSSAAAPRPSSG